MAFKVMERKYLSLIENIFKTIYSLQYLKTKVVRRVDINEGVHKFHNVKFDIEKTSGNSIMTPLCLHKNLKK